MGSVGLDSEACSEDSLVAPFWIASVTLWPD